MAQTPAAAPTSPEPPALFSRTAKQLGLFCAGAGFVIASTLITRRSIARKTLTSAPKFYTPQGIGAPGAPSPASSTSSSLGSSASKTTGEARADSQVDAFEALYLSTLNVFSWAVVITGGVAYAFDISSAEEFRDKSRRKMYNIAPGAADKSDAEVERELEEWAAGVLAKKRERGDKKKE